MGVCRPVFGAYRGYPTPHPQPRPPFLPAYPPHPRPGGSPSPPSRWAAGAPPFRSVTTCPGGSRTHSATLQRTSTPARHPLPPFNGGRGTRNLRNKALKNTLQVLNFCNTKNSQMFTNHLHSEKRCTIFAAPNH